MRRELEIEFKNMLNLDEYQRIAKKEFSEDVNFKEMIQTNYYFDTKNADLKKQGAALRIRTSSSFRELTLKSPSAGFLMETNIPLDEKTVSTILEKKELSLSADIFSNEKVHLENIPNNASFRLFNSMTTERFEKDEDIHLLVLDKTTFQGGQVDYELEVESQDEKIGREFFDSFLQSNAIPSRPAKPKIARAEYYLNKS